MFKTVSDVMKLSKRTGYFSNVGAILPGGLRS